MKKLNIVYEPHLVFRHHTLAPQGEWTPRFSSLAVIQVSQGTGYFLKPQLNQELPPGTLLLVGAGVQGTIRASQIGEFSLRYFNVIPSRLSGLMTLGEQRALELALLSKESSLKILPPESSQAIQMEGLSRGETLGGLACRLKMLQIVAEVFDLEIAPDTNDENVADAGQRLELFLKQTPISDLLEMNFSDLAQVTNCTSRHLSRLFHKFVGMSFNDKRAELRLARALDLLATSNLKVVDVALESGFKSLSQFNQVFVRHFGVSPGRWRQKNGSESTLAISQKLKTFEPATGNKMVFRLNSFRKSNDRLLAAELSPVN